MAQREQGRLSLADGLVARRAGQNERLDRIAAMMDWGPIEDRLSAIYASKLGLRYSCSARPPAAGIKDRVMHRGYKHGPLPHWRARRNRPIQPIRAAVEGVFGLMKRSYGYRQVRYLGLARNAVHLNLMCIAINLRRAEALMK